MSVKARDEQNRWRSKTVAFRMSPEENEALNRMVALSGVTKQEYIIRKLLNRDVVIHGNPRVFKALKNTLSDIHHELLRISECTSPSEDLLETVRIVTAILSEMNKED